MKKVLVLQQGLFHLWHSITGLVHYLGSTSVMKLIKELPIGYTARLNDIRLVNFSVDPAELGAHTQLPLLMLDGRPVISLLNVAVSGCARHF